MSTSAKTLTWQIASTDQRASLHLQQRLGIPAAVADVLTNRGLDVAAAEPFLSPKLKDSLPDPFSLRDMDAAAGRIIDALEMEQTLCVWGDYDVDGATSTALMVRVLRSLGGKVRIYIPDRLREGYGPNALGLCKLRGEGVDLVICVDSGTTAFAPLEAARDAGLDVIVIDHHTAQETLPPCVAVVNPNRLDEDSPLGHLAAVGVCFLVLVAVCSRLRAKGLNTPSLLPFLDIVALGTVCDVVPLQGLNRAFVAQGLKVMANRQNHGLKALADVAGLDSAPSCYHLGFVLGPRINAGGRIGETDLGARLLTTPDAFEAETLAHRLTAYNQERQAIEGEIFDAALAQIPTDTDAPALVVSGADWHPGVIGIVAGRLKERFHKPVIVIGFEGGKGKGSGRSVSGIHLGNLIIQAREQGLLTAGGGHAMAAGLSIDQAALAAFTAFIHESLASHRQPTLPTLKLEAALPPAAITVSLARALESLAPFGAANPQPRFCLTGCHIQSARVIKDSHVKLTCTDSGRQNRFDAMAFRALDSDLGPFLLGHIGQSVDLAGTIRLDSWNMQEKVQVFIDDARPATAHARLSKTG